MKNIILVASATLLVFATVSAQQPAIIQAPNTQQSAPSQPSGTPKTQDSAPVNNLIAVSDPGVPIQNTAPSSTGSQNQQNSQQNAPPAPKQAAPSNAPKTQDGPPVNNKIAVSDPGVPVESKPATSKKAAAKPTDKKKKSSGSGTGVTPK